VRWRLAEKANDWTEGPGLLQLRKGGKVLVSSIGGTGFAHRVSDGRALWVYVPPLARDPDERSGRLDPDDLIVIKPKVALTSETAPLDKLCVRAVDARTGHLVWAHMVAVPAFPTMEWPDIGTPVRVGDIALVMTRFPEPGGWKSPGLLYAFNIADGTLGWQQEVHDLPQSFWPSLFGNPLGNAFYRLDKQWSPGHSEVVLHSYETASGHSLWNTTINAGNDVNLRPHSASVTPGGNALLIVTGGFPAGVNGKETSETVTVTRVNASDGSIAWARDIVLEQHLCAEAIVTACASGSSAVVLPTASQKQGEEIRFDACLVALDTHGQVIWQHDCLSDLAPAFAGLSLRELTLQTTGDQMLVAGVLEKPRGSAQWLVLSFRAQGGHLQWFSEYPEKPERHGEAAPQ